VSLCPSHGRRSWPTSNPRKFIKKTKEKEKEPTWRFSSKEKAKIGLNFFFIFPSFLIIFKKKIFIFFSH